VLVLVGFALAACGKGSPSLLAGRGSESRAIAGVWWIMFGLATAVYVIVAGFILLAAVRGRLRSGPRESRVSDTGFIVVGGIAVPAVILAVLAVVTVHTASSLRRPDSRAVRIDVVGKQWWWAVDYPGLGITTANEVHVPVGRAVEIGLTSDNVLHSFWVPQLAGKVDTIPGQTNTLRFTVRKAGVYLGECAEFCGLQHARMKFQVIADPPAEFDRWVARERRPPGEPASELAARGAVAFQRLPCAGCHRIRDTQAQGTVGPDLSDFGSRRTVGAVTVPNTRGYLSGWISNAQALKPGNLMPQITMSPDDSASIVEYLESLK
jgi:cytochrome c oxidase subunit 2